MRLARARGSTPLLVALRMTRSALLNALRATSGSPDWIAPRVFFTALRSPLRMLRLRARRRRSWRARFFADLC